MVKMISSSLMATNTVSSKALNRILALEAPVSCLQHHVSILSKRLYKLDPPEPKEHRADMTPSSIIERDILRSTSGGKTAVGEGVAEEWLLVGDGNGGGV